MKWGKIGVIIGHRNVNNHHIRINDMVFAGFKNPKIAGIQPTDRTKPKSFFSLSLE